MTRKWDDALADKRAEYQELLFRLRSSEGVSFSQEPECSESPVLDSSDTSSSDSSRWEWCAGGPPRVTPTTPPSPKHSTNRLWRTVQHLYERVRRR